MHDDVRLTSRFLFPAMLAATATFGACGASDGFTAGSGGATARTGGTIGSGSGGGGPTGGTVGTGGMASVGTGGAPAGTGGIGSGGTSPVGSGGSGTGGTASGGRSATATGGATSSSGGSGATGLAGASGAGGTSGTVGTGGRSGTGGVPGTGGAAGGGGAGTGRLKVSADGRYLQWSDGTPIYLLSDTAWLLAARYSSQEVASHAMTRASQGFTAIQMTASFPENGYQSLGSVFNGGDFTNPVATYWSSLDAKIKQITDTGLVVLLNPFWKKTGDATINSNGPVKCRAYGKFLGTRYRENPRVTYFVGGDASPGTVREELEAMGLGIQEAYSEASLPPAIVAYHGAPQRSSREEFPTNPSWLNLSWTYAYSLPLGEVAPYEENWPDWQRTPPMPIMSGEGWYDRDNGASTASRFANRYMMRRQAWWNPISGALGGYAYGAEPIWFHRYGGYTPAQAVLWNSGLDAARMKTFLYTLQWWRLRPDFNQTLITGGNGTVGANDYAVGAMADDNSFGVVYVPTARNLTLRMPTGKTFTLRWYDPSNGSYGAASVAGASGAAVVMTHPGNNASGSPDWVIHIQS